MEARGRLTVTPEGVIHSIAVPELVTDFAIQQEPETSLIEQSGSGSCRPAA